MEGNWNNGTSLDGQDRVFEKEKMDIICNMIFYCIDCTFIVFSLIPTVFALCNDKTDESDVIFAAFILISGAATIYFKVLTHPHYFTLLLLLAILIKERYVGRLNHGEGGGATGENFEYLVLGVFIVALSVFYIMLALIETIIMSKFGQFNPERFDSFLFRQTLYGLGYLMILYYLIRGSDVGWRTGEREIGVL